VVIVAADKGLCGGYNANISRLFKKVLAQKKEVEVIAIGKKAVNEAKKASLPLVASYINLPNRLNAEFIRPIAQLVREKFLAGDYQTVEVIFTDYISSLTQKVEQKTLLPITLGQVDRLIEETKNEESTGETISDNPQTEYDSYIFEPSANIILNTVVPRLVDIGLFHALFESRASEESMRMFAMKNATENAQQLSDDLTLFYNRARQQGITQEIAEIAAGADALK